MALRCALLLAGLLVCAGVGWLIAALTKAPWAGLAASAAAGMFFWLAFDTMQRVRLMAWLRSDTGTVPPAAYGLWGEVGQQIARALRLRERQTLQEQQRLSQFLSAIDASPVGVLLLDAGQHISWCSRSAAAHLGLDPQRDLRQRITNLVRVPAFVEHLGIGEAEQTVSFIAPGGGGRLAVQVQTYGAGLKLVLTQDVTERERAEAMRRDFVANVSHEIRTPLTALSGFVETMIRLSLSDAERARVLALMTSQAQRMQTLVADLLTLAQLEGSPRPALDQWHAVDLLMRRVQIDAAALSAGRHQLAFGGGGGAEVAGSESELLSALGNLVVNAVRYTPDGGRIEVAWQSQADGGGTWEVRDDGIGIAREHLSRLTERFYRVDRSRSRDTGGTGLGLSIVKHVAQRHGGEIDVDSTPGKGSSFKLRLPAARVRAVSAAAPVTEHPAGVATTR